MEKLIEKISKFDLLVCFSSGMVLYYLIDRFTILQFKCDDIILKLGIYYSIGILNSCVGLIFFRFMKLIGIFNDIEYNEFISIDDKNNRPKILARNVSVYKAFIGALIIFIVFYSFQNCIHLNKEKAIYVLILISIISLIIKIREQLDFLNKINNKNKKKKKQYRL